MDLILAHIYNGMAGRHGAIHPVCRSCFDETAKSWAEDKMLALRLDEVAYPDSEPHEDYVPDECFYCHRRGTPCNS